MPAHRYRPLPTPISSLTFVAIALYNCLDGASRMFPAEAKKGKKGRKSSGAPAEEKGKEKEVPEPVDVLVDTVIGFLEKGTAYVRAVANQVFALLAGAVQASTIDLILTVSALSMC